MLNIIRAIFVVLAAVLGYVIGSKFSGSPEQGTILAVLTSLLVVILEAKYSRRFIALSAVVVVAVLFGFVVSHLLLAALHLIPAMGTVLQNNPELAFYVDFSVVFFVCFLSLIGILHTKDEFKIVLPFIEFARGKTAGRSLILDTSAIVDGRVIDLLQTRVLDGQIVVPRFVLSELHRLADSQDRLKRNRGRRGLEMLNRLRSDRTSAIVTPDVLLPQIEGVDNKLVNLAKSMDARILTTDFNLTKVAEVQGVDVVNLFQVARALRPPVFQGEKISIELVKAGENPGQGVGFLEDGTMVVAEGCADRIGQKVTLTVKNIIQTSAGRIIFGEPEAGRVASPK